jgi:hypothetical protein
MKQSIFYFETLKLWDKISIVLYFILSFGIWYFFNNTTNVSLQRNILTGYTLGTHIFIYFLNYKSLRNLTVYLLWILISILHLIFYFQLKDYPLLQNVHGHSATGLRNTFLLLLLFKVLRLISIKIQSVELVCPSRASKTDLFDERKVTYLDFILFVIYIVVAIFLLF